MTRRQGHGSAVEAAWSSVVANDEGAASQVTMRPVRLIVIESLLNDEIADLPDDKRDELRRRSQEVVQDWRACHAEELSREGDRQEDVPIEQLYGTGMGIVIENQRNALRNNIDVALKLCLEHYPPMSDVVSKFGENAVLASVALSDPRPTGRADSLVYLLILLFNKYRHAFETSKTYAKEMFERAHTEQQEQTEWLWSHLDAATSGWFTSATQFRDVVYRIAPVLDARRKSNAALSEHRSRGSQAIKERAAENRRIWRLLAKDMLGRHPTWTIDKLIDFIHTTEAGQNVYSDGT